jgi:peptidylprolyl isomerase
MAPVTKPGQTRQRDTATPARSPKREAKREMARQSAARRAAARRRRQARIGGIAGVVVVAVVVAIVLLLNNQKPTPGATASASPSIGASANPALATKPEVTKGTGTLAKLNVTTLVQGTGPAVQAGQTISVNYVGVSYQTGEEFDSSWKSGQPASFQIGTGKVIKGWDQGLVGVKVGSRVQLDIPADLAYGDNPSGGQPGGPLRFVVDVLSAS